MTAPRVSIVMAVHDGARHVDAALASLVTQTFADFEVLVVDDGSTDATTAIVARSAAADARVRLLRRANAGRPAVPRNDGLALARGEYVGFLDHDDWSYPERLAQAVAALDRHPAWIAAFQDLDLVDAGGALLGQTWLTRLDFPRACRADWRETDDGWLESLPGFAAYASLHTPGMMMHSVLIARRRFRGDLAFDTGFTICEDTDLWIRLALAGPVGLLPRACGAYRQHAGSLTTRRAAYLRDTARLHERNYERVRERFDAATLARYRERIGGHYANLGWHYYQSGDTARARAPLARAYQWWPSPEHRRLARRARLPGWLLRAARRLAGRA
jgi:succinoglycan biosynthesis protein ExoO